MTDQPQASESPHTEKATHLVIEKGPEQGGRLHIPEAGARIGRAPENDITLSDDSLSRYHCRMSFKDGLLVVSDLGSTNETRVNNRPVRETVLRAGDSIEVGETLLRVETPHADGRPAEPAAPVNLGFRPLVEDSLSPSRRALWFVILAAVLLVAAAALVRFLPDSASDGDTAPTGVELTLHYEKVEADANNIFRYELDLSDGTLSARVDDLENNRHIVHEQPLEENLIRSLGASLASSSFFRLQEEYSGIARDSYTVLDLEIAMGRQVHRSRVINRLEPQEFEEVRLLIEEFAENELGLAALAMPPEKLIELAKDATDLGVKLFDQRAIANGNLYRALQAFREANWYLETIEPKPDFYARSVSGEEEVRRLLNQWIEDYEFQAERAVKLNDWSRAAQELRAIIEQLPDSSDARYQKARRKLLDVERRLK